MIHFMYIAQSFAYKRLRSTTRTTKRYKTTDSHHIKEKRQTKSYTPNVFFREQTTLYCMLTKCPVSVSYIFLFCACLFRRAHILKHLLYRSSLLFMLLLSVLITKMENAQLVLLRCLVYIWHNIAYNDFIWSMLHGFVYNLLYSEFHFTFPERTRKEVRKKVAYHAINTFFSISLSRALFCS